MIKDVHKIKEKSTDLTHRLLQNILEALKKKKHSTLKLTSSCQLEQSES
ncbi:unnamed protein product [Spirodela intermedia]|uniref:Uncharacterized protein n=1 Tax=Spirodela intermedia TaxID=51605 RepID=A0A7I8JQ46_SPIIN|nr:unnamed protein product [Spirodela intermedia]CAA6671683.1 unnamed protein product [Spirodela intermedia]